MEFQISPDVAHLFADAAAAYIRGHADSVSLNEKSELWHELWTTFRDADDATVTMSQEAGVLMFWVWGSPRWWRDRATWQYVKSHLSPQWKRQMSPRVVARIEVREASSLMTISFEDYPEPKRWTSDGGRLHWSADGDVVVTCSEHGEVSRLLATAYLYKDYPQYHGNSVLAQDNHLWFEHGIAQGHHAWGREE